MWIRGTTETVPPPPPPPPRGRPTLRVLLVSFGWFFPAVSQQKKTTFLGTIFLWGRWRDPSVWYCTSAWLWCRAFSCYSPWCVLLCNRCSGVERVALLDWYCEWICWCPPLTQSLALYYLRSNLYYALLSYFLSTPISDFTTGVDPLKLPPIYYSTDDLLNFIFVMVAYL